MEVVLNPRLTLAAEHPILMYWAWTEFPMDQAATEEFDVVEFLQ